MHPNHDITMNQTESPVISRRQTAAGPLHHLWNNHGHWWFHGTFHLPDGTATRVRANLKTRDLCTARRRRDTLMAGLRIQSIPAAATV